MTDNNLLANFNYSFGYHHKPLITRHNNQKINTIGIIAYDIENYYTSSALKGIEQVAGEAGFGLIITNSQCSLEKEIANTHLLLHSGIEGLIALPRSRTNKLVHFNEFKRLGVPIVFFDQVQHHGQTDNIVTDHQGCGYMATEHLVMQGCRHISIVTTNCNAGNNLQYYKGYKDALKKHGFQHNPVILLPDGNHDIAGQNAAEYIMQVKPKPDGLLFTNDVAAASCMLVLKEAGISIPHDIAIVACGNTPVSRLVSPALTTVDCSGYEAGKAAATALFSRLNSNRLLVQHKITVMPAKLVVRNSSVKMLHTVN